jgi:hypothetical protein
MIACLGGQWIVHPDTDALNCDRGPLRSKRQNEVASVSWTSKLRARLDWSNKNKGMSGPLAPLRASQKRSFPGDSENGSLPGLNRMNCLSELYPETCCLIGGVATSFGRTMMGGLCPRLDRSAAHG